MPETHTPWRVRGTFVESDDRVICECSMAEDAERIVREHNDLAFHKQQASDAHQLLQTHGVQMRKLEQKLATARKLVATCLPFVMDAIPQRGHVGACGPESGCDAICMEVANISALAREVDQFLKETTRE